MINNKYIHDIIRKKERISTDFVCCIPKIKINDGHCEKCYNKYIISE